MMKKQNSSTDDSGADYSPEPEDISALVRDHLGQEPLSIRANPRPTFHGVFVVTMPHEVVAVKAALYERFKGSLLVEDHIYNELLAGTGLGVQVSALDVSCARYPFPFMLMKGARGALLFRTNPDLERLTEFLKALGPAAHKLHNINRGAFEGFGPIDRAAILKDGAFRGKFGSWTDFVMDGLAESLALALKHGVISREEHDSVARVFKDNEALFTDGIAGSLLHGDLGGHNVFVDEEDMSIRAIIDWERALIGDPAFDAATLCAFRGLNRHIGAFIEGYPLKGAEEREAFTLRLWLHYVRIMLKRHFVARNRGMAMHAIKVMTKKLRIGVQRLEEIS